jgi:hypothetical protein
MSAQRRIDAFLRSPTVVCVSPMYYFAKTCSRMRLDVQQVVERVARALLTHAGVAFGTSHNLAQMAEALPLEHPFRERIRAFDAFSSAVTAFRYPTSTGRLQQPPQTGEPSIRPETPLEAQGEQHSFSVFNIPTRDIPSPTTAGLCLRKADCGER